MRRCSAFLAAFALACATTHSDDRAAIIALENEWLAHEHDRATLERILAPEFQHPVFTGDVLDKAQHIDWATAHLPPSGVTSRFEHVDVRVFSDIAIATGVVARSDGVRTVFTDIFRFREGRWQAIQAQETPVPKSQK